ncbi:MAG: universal stress protein [Glaciihabitans sp.]
MDAKTVVGWDGAAQPSAAIDWALERERHRHGTIALVRVVDNTRSSDDFHSTTDALDAAQRDLTLQSTRLKDADPQLFVTTTAVRGDTLDELLRYTAPGTVLVVGAVRRDTRGRAGWSLGARLAAAANGPVVIVPQDYPTRDGPIVVGVDGSAESQLALDAAADEAELRDTELVLLHAWQEPVLVAEEYTVDIRLREAVEAQGHLVLEAAADRAGQAHPGLVIRPLLVHAPPEGSLIELGETARLLVVGSRHLRGLRRLLLGSVSHSIVIALPCPVMVVGLGTHRASGRAEQTR